MFAVPWAASGCSTPYALRVPPANEIPALEARRSQGPRDAETLILLGAAYRDVGRLEDAEEALTQARVVAPLSPDAAFFLGLTYEDMERFSEARGVYTRYLELAPSGPMAGRIADRVQYLRRAEIRASVREAAAREREMTGAPPDPGTLAVLPFLFEGAPSELAPLGMALSGMVTTDLALAGRLTVLERAQVEALYDEMALALAGAVPSEELALGGRILGAGRLVQGRLEGDEADLAVDAAILTVAANTAEAAATVAARDAVDRIFDLEKAIVLDIFDAMGVVLTPAERDRVTERRTESLAALLAYGRGIEASYRGDAAEAARQFSAAARIDPGFAEAASEAEAAESVVEAGATQTAELVQQGATEALEAVALEQEALAAVQGAADANPQRDGPITSGGPIRGATGVKVIVSRPPGEDR